MRTPMAVSEYVPASWVMYPGPQTQSPGLSEPPPTVVSPVGQAMQLFCPGLVGLFGPRNVGEWGYTGAMPAL